MNLSANEKDLIKYTFSLLSRNGSKVAEYFYNNLFDMAPLIKPLFKTEQKILEQHFYELISLAVDKIDNFEEIKPTLLSLGKKHKNYQAKIGHFEIVKAALILSIQYDLKGQCSDEVKIAWSKYIDEISKVMIEGLTADD